MFSVDVNYLAIFVSGILAMGIGAVWYGPLFGKKWMALSGMTSEQLAGAKQKGMSKSYAVAFVGTLVMGFVLAQVIGLANATDVMSGGVVGLGMWLGFVAPVTLSTVLWDNKPFALWVLNSGHYAVALALMGVILAVWG
jgi:hypothetical protein